jgi:hypothetical protein
METQKLIEKQTAKERLEGVTVERRTALLTVMAIAFRGLFAQWQPARRHDGRSCDRHIAIGALMHQYIFGREK